jgi:hypothetical protein
MTRNDMAQKRQKRGRPYKPAGEARTLSLPSIRVNPQELMFIEEQASMAGMAVSTYARSALTRKKVAPQRSDMDDKLMFELNRVGVNLNQLMRHINAGRDMPSSADSVLEDLQATLRKVSASYDT